MNEHEHQWDMQPYTSMCRRGTCYCGVVAFFPISQATAAVEQARLLNERHGRKGHIGRTAVPQNNEEKEEEVKLIEETDSGLSSVPPRPDVGNMPRFQARQALHRYYEDNAAAIITDYQRLGSKATRERWGFSSCGWQSFCVRHPVSLGIKPLSAVIKSDAEAPPGVPNRAAFRSKKHYISKEKFLKEMDKVKDEVLNDYYTMKLKDFPAYFGPPLAGHLCSFCSYICG